MDPDRPGRSGADSAAPSSNTCPVLGPGTLAATVASSPRGPFKSLLVGAGALISLGGGWKKGSDFSLKAV